MMRLSFMLALVLPAAVPASANQIVVDTNAPTSNYAYPFGNPFVTTIGQTFAAPAHGTDLSLDYFGFYLQGPVTETMKGCVYAWNGKEATGRALFTSPVESLPGTGGFDLIQFDTGGVPLTAGAQYILIATTADVPASVGESTMKYEAAPPAIRGGFYFEQGGDDFTQIFSPAWSATGWDTAFRAGFSGNGVSFVAEPTAALLMTIGIGFVGVLKCYLGSGSRSEPAAGAERAPEEGAPPD